MAKAKKEVVVAVDGEGIPSEKIVCKHDRSFDEGRLSTLANTIKEHGLLNPIALVQDGDKYKVIAGRRRFKALVTLLGIDVLLPNVHYKIWPAGTDAEAVSLVENFEREDLTLSDEVRLITQLRKRLSLEEMAKTLGRTKAWVALRCNLDNLTVDWKALMNANSNPSLTAGHYEVIARMPESRQDALYEDTGDEYNFDRLKEFKQEIEDDGMYLIDEAKFDLTECGLCKKRSHEQRDLFTDLLDTNQDYCLDPDCYEKKFDEFVSTTINHIQKQQKEKNADLHIISTRWSQHDGILCRYDYEVLPDDIVKNGFMVDGDEAGTWKTIKVTTPLKTAGDDAQEEKKSGGKTIESRELELLHKRERLAIQNLIADIKDTKKYPRPENSVILSLIGCCGVYPLEHGLNDLHSYDNLLYMDQNEIFQGYWENLVQFICGRLITDQGMTLDGVHVERAKIMCKILGLQWTSGYMKNATSEIKEPKILTELKAAAGKSGNN